MSFAPLFDPTNQFITKDGTPLFGGRLYVYKNGTENIAKVKNIAGTTIHQPIVTDANGRATGGVFVNDGSLYRFEVRDAYDALLWCIEGMSPIVGGGGSPAPSEDELWGHWVSGDVYGDWKIVNRGTPKNFEGVLKLKEGSINGIAIDTTLEDSSLDAGLYDYKLELAFNRYDSVDPREFASYDLKIYYGDQALRSMTFCFRCDTTDNYVLTEWAAGVFKLDNPGKIKIRVTANDNNDTYQHRLKVSHFFVHSIQ